MSLTLPKALAIREGLADAHEATQDALQAYDEHYCCCCSGECTMAFMESTEQEQADWLQNYWENVRPDLFWPWI